MTSDTTRLEDELFALFAVSPPAAITDPIDRRVEDALRSRRPRPARRRQVGRGRAILAIAAVFAIAGAGANLQQLYLFLNGPFDLPWHRGDEIGVSQVVDGYRVTIDRAYADATRLALAISVVDERRRAGFNELTAMGAVVTDEDGEYTSGGGATSAPDGRWAAATVTWKTPPILPLPAGPRRLHVVLPHIQVRDDATPPPEDAPTPLVPEDGWSPWHDHAGPWTFDIEVNVDGGGAAMTPNASAEVDGIRVTVERLIAAPAIVRVDLRVDADRVGDSWTAIGSVKHRERTMRFVMATLVEVGPMTILTDGGVDDPSGPWSVVIEEVHGMGPDGEIRVRGPWVVEFDGP